MTFSKSAKKVIQIVEIIGRHPGGLRVSEVAKLLKLNRTKAHRLVTSQARESWVTR